MGIRNPQKVNVNDGVQDTLPQNMSTWLVEDFKLKELETRQV